MWNDNETNIDLFGHARIAKTISALIREERMSSLTMGVHGDWGAGKSSVLQLVEQELKDDDDVLCLRFNGWLRTRIGLFLRPSPERSRVADRTRPRPFLLDRQRPQRPRLIR